MDDLNWLATHRFIEAIRHEYSWAFVFDGGAAVTTECLWRLIENSQIRVTNRDDGHPFGLPAPVDAALRVNQSLAGALVASVRLQEGKLDLEILFDNGHSLQIIPDSCGYESWHATDTSRNYEAIAGGGGKLTIFREGASR